jgi:hypothetical protein
VSVAAGAASVRIQELAIRMLTRYQEIDNLNDLRDYIYLTLCEHNQLQIGVYEMTERVLNRGGRPCGLYFCLFGPRTLRSTAIWETDRNHVFFYGSDGERFQKTQLTDAPRLECVAA